MQRARRRLPNMRISNPAYRSSAPAAVTSAPEYITKQIAAQMLGLSVRRVLELSQSGAIKRRQVTDPVTKRRQTVLLAKDVARAVAVADGQRRLVAYRGGSAGEVAVRPPVQPPLPAPVPTWMRSRRRSVRNKVITRTRRAQRHRGFRPPLYDLRSR